MSQADTEQARIDYALKVFKEYPDKVTPEIQSAILAGKATLGMTPYEAHLAAGAFAFKVIADQNHWRVNADPYQVMWKQSTQPDASQIWMTFKNETQYPDESKSTFRVFFEHGKAIQIEKLLEK